MCRKNRMLTAGRRELVSQGSSYKMGWKEIAIALPLTLIVIAWGITLVIPPPQTAAVKQSISATPELIQRGAYLARVGDCVACHSQPGKPPFSGGAPIPSPIGGMVPPNITPDKQFGIGTLSYADFDNAVRQGIRKDGTTLYPAMPWPSYRRISHHDMQALYAYFIHGIDAVPCAKNGASPTECARRSGKTGCLLC